MMNEPANASTDWYIVKQPGGHCNVVSADELNSAPAPSADSTADAEIQQWGPFASQSEAIARRVGLIRAGKCLPR